jgi:hypothetical protein
MSGSERFHTVLSELGALHDKKQQDYGTDADPFANVRGSLDWGIQPWIGALLRATDKMRRLQKFAQVGRLANEAVEDSFRDLAVYAIIGLILYEETQRENHLSAQAIIFQEEPTIGTDE